MEMRDGDGDGDGRMEIKKVRIKLWSRGDRTRKRNMKRNSYLEN
jgi:hypothetical protein